MNELELSDNAIALLRAGAAGGEILVTESFSGPSITANRESFIPDSNPRTAAIWRDALNELVRHGLVQPNNAGELYTVTGSGYKVVDELPLL